MRRDRYLNVILTVNAALLASVLWVQVAETPVVSQEAVAQGSRQPIVVPNASRQRQQIVEELKKLAKSMEATHKLIEGGGVKVEVTNLDQMTSDR